MVELRHIDRNTPLTVTVFGRNDEEAGQFEVKFFDTEKHISFLVESDELFEKAKEFARDAKLRVEFVQGARQYSFNAKFVRKAVYNTLEYVVLNQTSLISETSLRSAPRIDISLNIKIYMTEEDYRKDVFIAKGMSLDISANGVGVLSDDEIIAVDGDYRYRVCFEIGRRSFNLPARLMRRDDRPKLMQYKYKYGMVFDYADIPDERSRLITTMLDYQFNRKI
jgi:c-di-GMP-binding flagellar brake protein YcgR